jgi:hypothetical protein
MGDALRWMQKNRKSWLTVNVQINAAWIIIAIVAALRAAGVIN